MQKAFLFLLVFTASIAVTGRSFFYSEGVFQATNQRAIPELNQQVLDFAHSNLKKKVGRGECWDLAAQALNRAGAKWDGKLKYGKRLDAKTDIIFPGDIIQFEGVKLRFEKDGIRYTEVMKHHTAIVYEVTGPKQFVIAHQNTSQWGRKVGISSLDLSEVIKGKYYIYRPTR